MLIEGKQSSEVAVAPRKKTAVEAGPSRPSKKPVIQVASLEELLGRYDNRIAEAGNLSKGQRDFLEKTLASHINK